MATDRLPNHIQMETLNGHLSTIASKISDPYSSQHKLASDLVDDTNQTNKFATVAQLTQITTNKNDILSLRAYGGLKNYATINSGTYTASSGGGTHSVTIPLLSPITGDIVISIGNITSNDVDSSTNAFVFENDITNRDTVAVSRGDNIIVSVSMGTFVATKVEIYPAATYQTSSGDTVSWTDLMICTKEDWDNSHDYQPYALSNAELTTKEQQNENSILLKANKISFGFSGNPNPAVYVKDWDFVPDGTYLLTYICSQDASTRRGVSVYMFSKYTTNHIVLFTPVVEASGAIITSCVASGSAGAETITFTMAQRGYHTAAAIQIQAF